MANHDFGTEDEELATGVGLDIGSASEDLFDLSDEPYPALPAAVRSGGSETGARAAPESGSPDPARSRPPENPQTRKPYPPFDPVLDEDIFGFDERLLDPQRESVQYVSKAELMEVPDEPAALAQSSNAQVPRGDEHAVPPPRSPPASLIPRGSAAAHGGVSAYATLFSSRTAQLILAALLTVNAAFVFFAWQASHAFRDAVHEAREELARSRASTGAPPVSVAAIEAPDPAANHSHGAPSPRAVDEWVAGLDSPTEITFRIAEREIEEGEFAAARRRLYALLAVQDRTDVPAERLADAQYWIAESWARESAAAVSLASEKDDGEAR